MARNMNQVVQEQLGGLMFELLVRDLQLEEAREKIKVLENEVMMLKGQPDKRNGEAHPPTPPRPESGHGEAFQKGKVN